MHLHLNRQVLAIASCFLPFAVTAQTATPVPKLDNIVVTASRTAQPLKDVVGDVTVISNEELQKAGQSSLVDVLSKQPGVQSYTSGGPQTPTGVYLRGANAQHTLVLVDGVRVNSITTGTVNWPTIDPSIIERVEIVRGAASSLYGSDAIGGVINIITKKGGQDRPLAAWANIGYGSYDTFKSSVGLSGATDGWDYSVATSMAESSGFNATRPSSGLYDPDKDGYSQRSLSASLGYRWKPGQHIGVTAYNGYLNGDFDSGADFFTGDYIRPAYAITRQQAYTLTSTNEITEFWESVLRFGFTKEMGDSRTAGSASTYGSLQRSYMWQNNFKLSPDHQLSAVLERLEERPASEGNYDVNKRNTNAVGLIYKGSYGPTHMQASVRNDNISGYGNRVTGGLALDYDVTDEWQVGIAGNTGFRAPTFGDLYSPAAWGFSGNPDLRPERSRNIEAKLQYTTATTQIGLVVYQSKIKDLINSYVCDMNFVCTAENTSRATIRGATLTATQTYGNTTLRASADFMNPRDDNSGKLLPRRARQVYLLGIDHRQGLWTMGAEYQFTGKRYDDVENSDARRLGGYSLLNLTAAYDFTKNLGVQVRWNNVLDKDYTNAYGYNTPGSNVFVNLSWRM